MSKCKGRARMKANSASNVANTVLRRRALNMTGQQSGAHRWPTGSRTLTPGYLRVPAKTPFLEEEKPEGVPTRESYPLEQEPEELTRTQNSSHAFHNEESPSLLR
ncbi:hypothetical protein RUM43_011087 [Polyplax serrata]|uniref:Uncharacterized protein n=1 Tax=Polyplax serrata TaxID=468196 RepID=A0AAN8S7P7_POLSC